jgi:methionyl-tRNA formyltransferase
LKHPDINSEEFVNEIKVFNCDLFVSMSFNQIFKNQIINLPRLKTINCHAGKLPFYRGRNILNWALINDEDEFGITIHYVDEGIDTGDIILQRCYPISDKDNYSTLLEVAFVECAEALYDAVCMFKRGFVKAIPQKNIHPVGFYCSQRKAGDEILNWNQSSRAIFNFVRSICEPGPMARTKINGSEMKINKVELVDSAPNYIGTSGVILNKKKNTFLVKTLDNFIRVVDYKVDVNIRVGDRFESV